MRISDWSSDVCSSDLLFSAAGRQAARLCIAKQNSRLPPSSAGAPAPCRQAGGGVQARFRPRRAIAVKAAMGAARPQQEPAMPHESLPFLSPDTESTDHPHPLSPTELRTASIRENVCPNGYN